ncbi:MAG: hypothetical protein ACYCY7_13135, partial [Gallionella sp.]
RTLRLRSQGARNNLARPEHRQLGIRVGSSGYRILQIQGYLSDSDPSLSRIQITAIADDPKKLTTVLDFRECSKNYLMACRNINPTQSHFDGI